MLAALGMWLCAVLVGSGWLMRYEFSPGSPARQSSGWPDASDLTPAQGRMTLLFFAHPRCPCTRASVAELERLLPHLGDRAAIYAVLTRPPEARADQKWEDTDIRDSLAALPGVVLHADVGGIETDRFGVTTSGTVLLYDQHGLLRFTGGITPSRGHQGDSAGQQSVLRVVRGAGAPAAATCDVFGCPMQSGPREGDAS